MKGPLISEIVRLIPKSLEIKEVNIERSTGKLPIGADGIVDLLINPAEAVRLKNSDPPSLTLFSDQR